LTLTAAPAALSSGSMMSHPTENEYGHSNPLLVVRPTTENNESERVVPMRTDADINPVLSFLSS
jgi:hypothetical protein